MNIYHRNQLFNLREMVFGDIAELLTIERRCHSHPWSKKHFMSSIDSSHQCCVLQAADKIAAYAITSTTVDEAELLNLTVALDYQRQGIGKRVLEIVMQSFQNTISTLFLEVRSSNHSAIALYDALNFNEVGLRANYYPAHNNRREDAIIMAKLLNI